MTPPDNLRQLQIVQGGDPPPPPPARAGEPRTLSDLGNAQRLVDHYGHRLRYCHPLKTWFIWTGERWTADDTGAVMRCAQTIPDIIWEEAKTTNDSDAFKHAGATRARPKLKGMIELAQAIKPVPITPDQLDADPWLLNVANGTIDMRTGTLLPHDPANLITKTAGTHYDPASTCPTWFAFLERILPDPDVRTMLQRSLGWSLTGVIRLQQLMLLYGGGANGKSVYLETCQSLAGDYGQQAPPDLLIERKGNNGGPSPELMRLKGVRLVTSQETGEGHRMAESLVKQLTGGDRITARGLNQDFITFLPTHKLWLATNHKPIIRGADHGIWRRIRLVPFTVTIPESEQDKELGDKLLQELPGILAWAVQGCLDWQQHGLGEAAAVTSATDAYRTEMDVIGGFLEECCIVHDGAWAYARELYESYTRWCSDNGERPLSQKGLGARLSDRGFVSRLYGQARRTAWFGVGLSNQPVLQPHAPPAPPAQSSLSGEDLT